MSFLQQLFSPEAAQHAVAAWGFFRTCLFLANDETQKGIAEVLRDLFKDKILTVGKLTVKRFLGDHNFHLERLYSTALALAIDEELKKEWKHSGLKYSDFPNREAKDRQKKLQKLFESNDRPHECANLIEATMFGTAEQVALAAEAMLQVFFEDSMAQWIEKNTKRWPDFKAGSGSLFFASFKKIFPESEHEKGRIAYKRDLARNTLQAIEAGRAEAQKIGAEQKKAIDSLESAMNVALGELKIGIDSFPDWTPFFASIEEQIRASEEAIKSQVRMSGEEVKAHVTAEGQNIQAALHTGLSDIRQALVEISALDRTTINFLESERDALFDSLSGRKPRFRESEIIRGVCSFDIQVRRLAASMAGYFGVVAAIPMLIDNLEFGDRDLSMASLSSLGQLPSQGYSAQVTKFAVESDDHELKVVAVSTLARMDPTAITEVTLPIWMKWFDSRDEDIVWHAFQSLRRDQLKGMLDLAAFADQLIATTKMENSRRKEWALWLLSEIPDSSNWVGAVKILQDPEEDKFVRNACANMLLYDRNYGPLAEVVNWQIDIEIDGSDKFLRNLTVCCVDIDHDGCKLAISRFKHKFAASAWRSVAVARGLSKGERTILSPKAVSIGGQAKRQQLLAGNQELQRQMRFFLVDPLGDNRSGYRKLPIQVMDYSPFSVDDVMAYLQAHFSCTAIDLRNATLADIACEARGVDREDRCVVAIGKEHFNEVQRLFFAYPTENREDHGCSLIFVATQSDWNSVYISSKSHDVLRNAVEV